MWRAVSGDLGLDSGWLGESRNPEEFSKSGLFFKLDFTNVQISHMARTPCAVNRDGLVTVLGAVWSWRQW